MIQVLGFHRVPWVDFHFGFFRQFFFFYTFSVWINFWLKNKFSFLTLKFKPFEWQKKFTFKVFFLDELKGCQLTKTKVKTIAFVNFKMSVIPVLRLKLFYFSTLSWWKTNHLELFLPLFDKMLKKQKMKKRTLTTLQQNNSFHF